MRLLLLAAIASLAPGCIGLDTGGTTGGDGCSYAWEYRGARITDQYAAPSVSNATQLVNGTRLRERFDVFGPDFIRKADYAGEDGDYWRWQFPTEQSATGYAGTLRGYVDPNGTLISVRIIHEWRVWDRENVSGVTMGNVSLAKAKMEPRYQSDLRALAPEAEAVRAALAPVLNGTPESETLMLWRAERNGCV